MDFKTPFIIIVLLSHVATIVNAQESPFLGNWLLEISQRGSLQTGILAIEKSGDELVGFLQNGPITLDIEGDGITMAIDTRTGGGGDFERYFTGVINGTQMSGEFGAPPDATEEELLVCERFILSCIYPTGTWSAVPYIPPRPETTEPRPFDLSGLWGSTSGTGMLKWSAALTPQSQAWQDEYDLDLDLPSLRCANSGVFWLQRAAPEIFVQDHKLTFVSGSAVRYIYMDGRVPDEFLPYSETGFSQGHWEGDHLMIETTLLSGSLRGYMGEVYSENTKMLERYWLNDDGTLSGEMELQDPENFARPPLQRTRWARRVDESVPARGACDVDSFFRQTYEDGLMQEYIDRSDRRF